MAPSSSPSSEATAPVLVLGFNRPHLMAEQIVSLRDVAPTRLYIAVDGPRESVPADREATAAVLACADLVDWSCEVQVLARESNLGCGRAVSEAITWFLEHEERGIIIEDDVRVAPDFHRLATELLERYADDHRVHSICGLSPDTSEQRVQQVDSYRFSAVPLLWGWATWRRAWQGYALDLNDWEDRVDLRSIARAHGWPGLLTAVLRARATACASGAVDTWDTQFTLQSLAANGLHIVPRHAVATNVGVLDDPTHAGYEPASLRPLEPVEWPLRHPAAVEVHTRVDSVSLSRHFEASVPGLLRKARRRIGHRLAVRKAR